MEPTPNYSKLCSYCGEKISVFERRCPFCGSRLNTSDNYQQPYFNPNTQYQQPNLNGMPGFQYMNPEYPYNQMPTQAPFQQPQQVPYKQSPQAQYQQPQQFFYQQPQQGPFQYPQQPVPDAAQENREKEAADANGNTDKMHDTDQNLRMPAEEKLRTEGHPDADINTLSNRFKVFLTAVCSAVPGLGQLIGIIISIIFMNSEESQDRRMFGAALMVASLVVFAFQLLLFFVLILAISPYSY